MLQGCSSEHEHVTLIIPSSQFAPIFLRRASCERYAIKNENQLGIFQRDKKGKKKLDRRRRRIKIRSARVRCAENILFYYSFAYRFNEKNSYLLHASQSLINKTYRLDLKQDTIFVMHAVPFMQNCAGGDTRVARVNITGENSIPNTPQMPLLLVNVCDIKLKVTNHGRHPSLHIHTPRCPKQRSFHTHMQASHSDDGTAYTKYIPRMKAVMALKCTSV